MYEVTCWQGLTVKFTSRDGAIRYSVRLQDSGVRLVSIWDPANVDQSLRAVRAFLEARSDLMRELLAIEGGGLCPPPNRETALADLRRRIAELDEFLVQA